MKIPTSPPNTNQLTHELLSQGEKATNTLFRILHQEKTTTPGGRYRHWHKLQHLPPPNNLTHHQWWLAIKLARRALYQPIPLQDVQGQAFQFAMPGIAQQMVHMIDRRASGSIESAEPLPPLPNQHRYLILSLQEEAISSSQLEGAATTRQDAKRMLREERKPQNKSDRMILNNYHGMQFITGQAKDAPLTPELIFELHRVLTVDTLDDPQSAGRFRQDDEEIVVQDMEGRTLHTPPPETSLPARLQTLCDFANVTSDTPFIHPVIRSILLHFWLAYDHPFVDGNGRTARALFYWSMARHGYWLMEHVSISRLLMQARSSYHRAFLYTETDENDVTYFLLHQCRIILRSIDDLHSWLGRKMEDQRRVRDMLQTTAVAAFDFNHRQLALVRHTLDHPGTVYSIHQHQMYHGLSYGTARSDLLGVVEMGLFLQSRRGRAFVFVAQGDLGEKLTGS